MRTRSDIVIIADAGHGKIGVISELVMHLSDNNYTLFIASIRSIINHQHCMDLGRRGLGVGANTGGVPKFATGPAAYIRNSLFWR
jgi:hypothetical protein